MGCTAGDPEAGMGSQVNGVRALGTLAGSSIRCLGFLTVKLGQVCWLWSVAGTGFGVGFRLHLRNWLWGRCF